jgi:hypothetical protein
MAKAEEVLCFYGHRVLEALGEGSPSVSDRASEDWSWRWLEAGWLQLRTRRKDLRWLDYRLPGWTHHPSPMFFCLRTWLLNLYVFRLPYSESRSLPPPTLLLDHVPMAGQLSLATCLSSGLPLR